MLDPGSEQGRRQVRWFRVTPSLPLAEQLFHCHLIPQQHPPRTCPLPRGSCTVQSSTQLSPSHPAPVDCPDPSSCGTQQVPLLPGSSCQIHLLSRCVLAFTGRIGFLEERRDRTEEKLEGGQREIKGSRRERGKSSK